MGRDNCKGGRIGAWRLPQQSWQHLCKVGGVLAAPACHFKCQSLRRQYAPQHFEYRLAIASDMWIMQAWIGFFGHPGSQQGIRRLMAPTRLAEPWPPSDRACRSL